MIKNVQSGRVCFWKAARVVLIPKSTAKISPSGYRPISLLLIPSKTPLKLILILLITDHLTEHHPISDAQWGFQKKKSTLTAHDWLTNWMRIKKYAVIFTSRRPLMMFPTEDMYMEKLKQLYLHI